MKTIVVKKIISKLSVPSIATKPELRICLTLVLNIISIPYTNQEVFSGHFIFPYN